MKHKKQTSLQVLQIDHVTCNKCGKKIDNGVEITVTLKTYLPHSHVVGPDRIFDICNECLLNINLPDEPNEHEPTPLISVPFWVTNGT